LTVVEIWRCYAWVERHNVKPKYTPPPLLQLNKPVIGCEIHDQAIINDICLEDIGYRKSQGSVFWFSNFGIASLERQIIEKNKCL